MISKLNKIIFWWNGFNYALNANNLSNNVNIENLTLTKNKED